MNQKGIVHPNSSETACTGVLALLKAVVNAPSKALPQLWLITQTAQFIPGQILALNPLQAALWGLGRTLRWEHPELWGGLIDVDAPLNYRETLAQALLAHIKDPSGEDEAAFRGGQRYVARLEQVTQPQAEPSASPVQPDATYLITGGTGALGCAVSHWLVDQGARNLVLVGRRGLLPEHKPMAEALQARGVTLRVEAVDVADAVQVDALLQRLRQQMPPLKGVLHAAGTLADSTLLNLSPAQFAQVMAPKVKGAWNLHQATRTDSLDWFVLFSSIASLLGSPGQANYGAANACLDALAQHRRQQGLPAQSISWGPWSGEGMAAISSSQENFRGLQKLAVKRALSLLSKSLQAPQSHLAIADVDWSVVQSSIPLALPPLLARVLPSTTSSTPNADGSKLEATSQRAELLPQLLSLTPEARKSALVAYFQQEVGQVLGLTEAAPTDRSLLDLGLDSLMTVDLLNLCRRDLQITLYPREVLAHPTIQALAQYVAKELVRLQGSPAVSAETSKPDEAATSDLLSQGFWTSRPLAASPEQRNHSMVFLLSSPRAGSTLLRVMLAGHPDLFCPPELHLLPFDTLGERHTALGGSYLEEGLQRALMELMQLDADAAQGLLAEWMDRNAPIQAIYDKLQQLAGNRLLVDKSPTYSLSLAALQRAEQLFENAKFIHLVRHPYAVIDSFAKNRMHKIFNLEPENPYRLAEQVWDVSNRNIQTFLQTVDPQRQHVLRYEDLVSSPEDAMRRLCTFLELPFDPAVLTPYEGKRMTDGVRA
ncbi:MAG TPA: SDR family NAD(P)-dependent oxidoreductase, partial [Trichocoleus sp.]